MIIVLCWCSTMYFLENTEPFASHSLSEKASIIKHSSFQMGEIKRCQQEANAVGMFENKFLPRLSTERVIQWLEW